MKHGNEAKGGRQVAGKGIGKGKNGQGMDDEKRKETGDG